MLSEECLHNSLMASVAAFIDVVACATRFLFCGACLYISVVEHPARFELPPRVAAQCFQRTYPRALILQPILSTSSALASVVQVLAPWQAACRASLQRAHLLNIVTHIIVIVWSRKAVMPPAKVLMAKVDQLSEAQIQQMLQQWGSRHAVRTWLSLIAAVTILIAQ